MRSRIMERIGYDLRSPDSLSEPSGLGQFLLVHNSKIRQTSMYDS